MGFWSDLRNRWRRLWQVRRCRAWQVDRDGERFLIDGRERRWCDLVAVACWKRDLITTDQIVLGLTFTQGSGERFEEFLEEDNPGYRAVREVLRQRCGRDAFEGRTPPFDPQRVVLWTIADG